MHCPPIAVNPSGFVKKYNKKYPHCANVKCMNNTPKRTFEKECAKQKICTGFTFQSGKSTGHGCLKKCGAKEFGGYGSGAYDYWAKAAKKPGIVYTFTYLRVPSLFDTHTHTHTHTHTRIYIYIYMYIFFPP